MNREWQRDLDLHGPAPEVCLPPAMITETGWDILLALRLDEDRGQSVEKLGALASVHQGILSVWLSNLEDRRLIAAARNELTGDLVAVLTRDGHELLDRYSSAIAVFQAHSQH